MFNTWHPCASSHATLQDPAINHGTMRHHPAPITCLHSRPRFWTLGPRPLSIVPTIPTRFRLVPISYHCSKFSHWATYTIALLLLSPHCFCLIPNRFCHCPVWSTLLFYCFPLFSFRTMTPRSTIVRTSIYTLAVASPSPHLDLLVFIGLGTPLVCIRYFANTWSLLG